MNYVKDKLSKQLLILIAIAFLILFISLGIILPKMIIPVAEKNIYNYLSEPLKLINKDLDKNIKNKDIAYIYIIDNTTVASDNFKDVINADNPKNILNNLDHTYGKFDYKHKTYYYYTIKNENIIKIALTNNNYINRIKTSMLATIFPIVLITCLLIGLLLTIWSTIIVKKIEKLKEKIDNIDNQDYNHNIDFEIDDEIKSLAYAIEDMRMTLINQEEYRNQMYQNISHDFKTPLTVIKSYIEAVHDNIETESEALKVIEQQTNKLELKVHSLLYLNKLDYLKDSKHVKLVPVDMEKIMNSEVEKFKFHRKEIEFEVEIDKKSKYYGTDEHWETILDNLLNNFMRYTKNTIKITAKQNKLILFNDGDKIEDSLLEGIFTPFRKGIKGEFGLGLSIVKKTLQIMQYDIFIKNEKNGVSFIITKK